jgi:HD-GYP domain-containing protein (c-di-GMP phosphodiesterase class II)
MPRSVYVVVWLIAALSAVSGAAVLGLGEAISSEAVRAVACMCALSAVAHLMPYQRVRAGSGGSIAFIPILASVYMVPSWLTVATVSACAIAVEISRKRPLLKGAFNVSQHVLCVSLAILTFWILGGEPALGRREIQILPMIAAAVVFLAVNNIAVTLVVALSEQRPVWQVLRRNTLSGLPYDLMSLPIVYAFAHVYVEWGITGSFMLAAPLLGMRQLYKTNWLLEKTNQELLELMVAAIEARDPYTSGHSRRVARNARIIARACGLSSREIERVSIAALLHDVGKIHEIYAPILRKPGRLTIEEQHVMESHPLKSVELVRNVTDLQDILPAIMHHHENWDGTGYPARIAGNQIPVGARIIRFADTIDAMTSDRPYRPALAKKEVRAELLRYRGIQFDPSMSDLLLASPLFHQLFEGASMTPISSASVGGRRIRRLVGA